MVVIIPSDTEVRDAAAMAAASHLHLITDGHRTLLSPFVLPGWTRLSVAVKPAQEATR